MRVSQPPSRENSAKTQEAGGLRAKSFRTDGEEKCKKGFVHSEGGERALQGKGVEGVLDSLQ